MIQYAVAVMEISKPNAGDRVRQPELAETVSYQLEPFSNDPFYCQQWKRALLELERCVVSHWLVCLVSEAGLV